MRADGTWADRDVYSVRRGDRSRHGSKEEDMTGSGRLFGILCGCLCLEAADPFSPQAAGALPGSSPPPTVAKTSFRAPQNCPRGASHLTHSDVPQSRFFHVCSPALI